MMDDSTLRKIDLNLLLAFAVVMQERNVTRAAERLRLGQPGLSAALKRLRDTLGDELFVRVGRGLQPTPRALAIAPIIEDALSGIEQAIRPPPAFHPATWTGEFRVGMSDTLEWAYLGPLVAQLRTLAPNARLVSVTSDRRDAARQLDDGAYDFSIGRHDEPASWHICAPLFTQRSICMFDPRQVGFDRRLTLDDFACLPHVALAFDEGAVTTADAALGALGRERRVAVAVPHYSAIPPALRVMPALAIVPESIGQCMAPLYGLTVSEPPIQLPAEEISMLYRRVDETDGRAIWFRRLFADVVTASLP